MNPLLSVDWLASHLHDDNVVVLDATLPPVGVKSPVDTRALYAERHIPGAAFFDIDELSDHSTPLPHMLPTEENFAESMAMLGVNDQATVVIYEQEGVFSAPRAWWMLRVFGVKDVRLLDGGLRAWTEAGLPVESGVVLRARSTFKAKIDTDAIIDFKGILHLIQNKGQILDARSAGRFSGQAPEPRPGISSGHMPGATNLPFMELAENGRLKPPAALRAIFSSRGIDMALPVATTCGSGVTAAVLALGLQIAGAKSVRLYDGSWAEYAQRPEAVIDKSEG